MSRNQPDDVNGESNTSIVRHRGDNHVEPRISNSRTSKVTMRKSCGFCYVRKRKCDGDGFNMCSFCLAKGQKNCVYTRRRRKTSSRGQPAGAWEGAPELDVEMEALQPLARSRLIGAGSTLKSSNGEKLRHRLIAPVESLPGAYLSTLAETRCCALRSCYPRVSSFSSTGRCRLRASPATGLVGVEENDLLGAYFNCIGFLPLACQRSIREVMARVMLASGRKQARLCSGEGSGEGKRARESGVLDEDDQHSKDAAACTFWCAIALGGLVQGQPVSSVVRYIRLAEDALQLCANTRTLQVSRGYAALAYVYSFSEGDERVIISYLQRADIIISDLTVKETKEDVPEDFALLTRQVDKVKIASGRFSDDEAFIQAYLAERSPPLSTVDIATPSDTFEYITLFSRQLGRAGILDSQGADWNSSGPGGDKLSEERDGDDGADGVDGSDGGGVGEEGTARSGATSAVSRFLLEQSNEIKRMQKASRRPEIRVGMGGIYYSRGLMLLCAANDDLKGAMEAVDDALEVFNRYPGLCRNMIGLHTVHVMSLLLLAVDDREKYDEIEEIYNTARTQGSEPMPPMHERRTMVEGCKNLFCRMTNACGARNELGFVSRALWADGVHEEASESGTSDGVAVDSISADGIAVDDISADGFASAMGSDSGEGVDSSESLIGQILPGLFGDISSSMGDDQVDGFPREGSIDVGAVAEGVMLCDEDWQDVTDVLSMPSSSLG